jgi:hypothetical protein
MELTSAHFYLLLVLVRCFMYYMATLLIYFNNWSTGKHISI